MRLHQKIPTKLSVRLSSPQQVLHLCPGRQRRFEALDPPPPAIPSSKVYPELPQQLGGVRGSRGRRERHEGKTRRVPPAPPSRRAIPIRAGRGRGRDRQIPRCFCLGPILSTPHLHRGRIPTNKGEGVRGGPNSSATVVCTPEETTLSSPFGDFLRDN